MHFIQEGVVQLITNTQNEIREETLSLGQHFGEMSVLTNWKSDVEVKAMVFTIAAVFTRTDFEQIQKDYPEMEQRLKKGFKTYKNLNKDETLDYLAQCTVFQKLTRSQLETLYMDYMSDVFYNPEGIIILPFEQINGFYFILKGNVIVYQILADKHNYHADVLNYCIDDQIYSILDYNQKIRVSNIVKEEVFKLIKLKQYQYFGYISQEAEEQSKINQNSKYFISETSCHFLVLTKNIMRKLEQEQPAMYYTLSECLEQQQLIENKFYINMTNQYKRNPSLEIDIYTRVIVQKYADKFKGLLKKNKQKQKEQNIYQRLSNLLNLLEEQKTQIARIQKGLKLINKS